MRGVLGAGPLHYTAPRPGREPWSRGSTLAFSSIERPFFRNGRFCYPNAYLGSGHDVGVSGRVSQPARGPEPKALQSQPALVIHLADLQVGRRGHGAYRRQGQRQRQPVTGHRHEGKLDGEQRQASL